MAAASRNVTLPISREINRRAALHCERRDGVSLIAIRHAPVTEEVTGEIEEIEQQRLCSLQTILQLIWESPASHPL
jgi:hypothetical protein